jgi:hypothetical protein
MVSGNGGDGRAHVEAKDAFARRVKTLGKQVNNTTIRVDLVVQSLDVAMDTPEYGVLLKHGITVLNGRRDRQGVKGRELGMAKRG